MNQADEGTVTPLSPCPRFVLCGNCAVEMTRVTVVGGMLPPSSRFICHKCGAKKGVGD